MSIKVASLLLFTLLLVVGSARLAVADEPISPITISRIEMEVRRYLPRYLPQARQIWEREQWRLRSLLSRYRLPASHSFRRQDDFWVSMPSLPTFMICPMAEPELPLNPNALPVAVTNQLIQAVGYVIPNGPAALAVSQGRWAVTVQTSHSPGKTETVLTGLPFGNARESKLTLGYALGSDTWLRAKLATADPGGFEVGLPGLIAVQGMVEARQVGLTIEQRLAANLALAVGFSRSDLAANLALGGSLVRQAGEQPVIRAAVLEQGLGYVPPIWRGEARRLTNQAFSQGSSVLTRTLGIEAATIGAVWRPTGWLQMRASYQHGVVHTADWQRPYRNFGATADVALNRQLRLSVGAQGLAPNASLGWEDGDTSISLGWQKSQPTIDRLAGNPGGDDFNLSATWRF